MKLYKYQKFLESVEDIHSICKKYGIEDYTVNEGGSMILINRFNSLAIKFYMQ